MYNSLVLYVVINDDNWTIYSLLLYKHCPSSMLLPYSWMAVTALWLHQGVMCQHIAAWQSCFIKGTQSYT